MYGLGSGVRCSSVHIVTVILLANLRSHESLMKTGVTGFRQISFDEMIDNYKSVIVIGYRMKPHISILSLRPISHFV